MNILIVYPKMYVYGGAELLVVRLANYLSRIGIKNSLLTTEILPEIEDDLENTQLIIPQMRKLNSKRKIASLAAGHLWLRKMIREKRKDYDLINVHNYPAELCTFPYSTPVVWMCNEPPDVAVQVRIAQSSKLSLKRLLFKALLAFERYVVRNYVKNVVVADQFNKQRFIQLYGFEPHVISYGIDYDYFAAKPPEAITASNNTFCILHVGMLTPLKNQLESIKTVEKLKDTIPDIQLILAGLGEGEYPEMIKAYLNEHQLQDHVEITGHLSRDQIRALFHSSDALLHPIASQGGWLSPFEALCAGLPIVVSPEMTAASLVKKENLGVVTEDYVGALLDIYRNPDKYNKLTDRRATWVRENLSWDKFSENMIAVFQKVLAGKNKGQR